MSKVIATFSNGFTDEYKGTRNVRAAWMISDKTGKVLASGHSIDRATAAKTARAEAPRHTGLPRVDRPMRGAANPAYYGYVAKLARDAGFKNTKEHYADYQNKLAAALTNIKIEVVDLP